MNGPPERGKGEASLAQADRIHPFVSLSGVVEDPRRWAMAYFDEAANVDSLEALLRRGTYEYLASTFPTLAGPLCRTSEHDPKVRVLLPLSDR